MDGTLPSRVKLRKLVRCLLLSVWVGGMPLGHAWAADQATSPNPHARPQVQELGKQRYRVGRIEVDQARQRLQIPGVLLRLEPPLEFLAVTKGGMKGYESLLELDTSADEFNLACLLLGFDAKKATVPRYHFDPNPVEGEAVRIWATWRVKGQDTRVHAADLVRSDERTMPRDEWVYTGSGFAPDGAYLAHMDGTLIGFVHDPASIIEHRSGFGLGKFGSIRPNEALLPPVGTPITLIIERRKTSQSRREGTP